MLILYSSSCNCNKTDGMSGHLYQFTVYDTEAEIWQSLTFVTI